MYGDESGPGPVTLPRVFRVFAPWIVLFMVVLAIMNAWGSFQRAEKPPLNGGASAEETITPSSPTTSTAEEINDLEALVLKEVKLRALPNDTSEILASAKKGVILEILVKDGTRFKVKDKAGHVGWIPNDSEVITVRKRD